MGTWTARAPVGADPDDVLAVLTDPSAAARWSPVGFDVEQIDGELIGGCDIVTEMYETGELAERLGVAQPDAEPEPPTVDAPQSAPLGIENRLN